jgi:hypothetical protein
MEGPDFGREVQDIDTEICIRRIKLSKNKEEWQKCIDDSL